MTVSKLPETKKGKGKGKSSRPASKDGRKVTVTKVPVKRKDTDASSLGEPPAGGTRAAKRKKRMMRKRSKREQYEQERCEILAVNVNILDIGITSEISPEESENRTYYIN